MPPPAQPSAGVPIRNAWLLGRNADLFLFIAIPLAAFPSFQLLSALIPFTVLKLAVLSVSATGHHLPGFIRAYTDRSIFDRFKWRLIVVPLLFIALAAVSGYLKLSLIFFLLIVWSVWHGSMQIHGFLRIYDLKAGFVSRAAARLDLWMCLAWFVQVVLWAPPKKMSVLSSFYQSGGPMIPASWAAWFEAAWLALTLGLTAAYAVLTWVNFSRHGYFNPAKLACMIASFGFWAFCMIRIENLLIGLLLWEVFHDAQYNVFVWQYNRSRVDRGLSGSALERFLFRRDWGRLALYAACIVAYGALGLLTQDVLNAYQGGEGYAGLFSQFGNVFAASALIHFYLDGFIWGVRDAKVRADLGAANPSDGAGTAGFGRHNELRHWVLIGLLFAACGLLGASERLAWTRAQERAQVDNLADVVPGSAYANFVKATFLKAEGKPDSARHFFERAIAFDTTYRFSRSVIGDLEYGEGRLKEAAGHYRLAMEHDPDEAAVREKLAMALLQLGDFGEAKGLYLDLAERDPGNAGYAYQIAWCLLQTKKGLEAKPWLERTLALDPRQPKAANYLGMVEQAQGNLERACGLYRAALELDSAYAHARDNLAQCRAGASPQ